MPWAWTAAAGNYYVLDGQIRLLFETSDRQSDRVLDFKSLNI